MKISKTRIAIAVSVCVLILIVVLSLGGPKTKPLAPKTETAAREQASTHTGKYELPPSGTAVTAPPQHMTTPSAAKKAAAERNAEEARAITPPVDSISPEAAAEDARAKEGKNPPPGFTEQMYNKGIVAY